MTTKTRVQNPSMWRNATKIIPFPSFCYLLLSQDTAIPRKKKDVIMKINLFYLTQGHALLTYLSDHRWSQMEATLHFYSSFSWWYTERNLWIFTVPSQRLMLWLLKGASVQQLNGLKTSQRIHKKDGEINDTENTSVKLCRRPARLANPVCEL